MSLGSLVTGTAIVVAASLTCVAGVDLVRFDQLATTAQGVLDELIAQDVAEEPTKEQIERAARANDAVTQLRPWLARDGVACEARRLHGAIAAIDDPLTAEEGAIAVLSVEPSSGEQWAELARLRAARAAPVSEVLSALQMSTVTAPREAEAMQRRLPLLLQMWSALPDDEKRHAANLLIELRGGQTAAARAIVKALILALPQQERQTLAEKVVARAGEKAPWLRQIGLR